MFKAEKFFQVLLLAYPRQFRREYEREMVTVFRDCYRATEPRFRALGASAFWAHIFLDLVQTVPKEHFEDFGRKNLFMKDLKKDVLALIGCAAIIVFALLLLTYGRKHEVSSILIFGYALDAMVTAGVAGNLIVFLLVKITRFNPLRIAFWTFLIVNAVPAVVLAIISSRLSPASRPGATVIGYAVSFVFWLGIHWMWAQWQNSERLAPSNGQ